jgi:hypothetical protein
MAEGSYSLLPLPEQQIRIPSRTHFGDADVARNPIPFLKLDIIRHDDIGKQGLEFVDSEEFSRANDEE